jgi:hypothetical protein
MTTPECKSFREYVYDQANFVRKLLLFEEIKDSSKCIVKVRVECWSCGKYGVNRFTRDLLLFFPDVETIEIAREYSLN